ncbi:MAG: ABC transporter permease subunit [Candidatus Eisenbacteria bacterium]
MAFKNLSLTATVFLTEIRSAVRDRHVVVYSLVLPIFLYPVMLLVFAQAIQYRKGALERQTSRVAWEGEEVFPRLFAEILQDGRFETVSAENGERAVAAGEIDALVRVRALEGNGPGIEAFFDFSSDRSTTARDRLRERWEEVRSALLRERAAGYGATEELLRVLAVREENVASPEAMGRFILSLLLPMILVIMLSMGAMYPAIDVLVGERERGTLESLLAAGAPRASVVAGKFLSVLAASLAALLVNLASMILTLRHQASLFGGEGELSIGVPWSAIPVILGGGLLLGAFFSASMILISSSARTFKEGQGYLTPFYILSLVPAVVGASPGIDFGPLTALIPLTNVTLLFRSALVGRFPPAPIAVTLLSLLTYLIAVLYLAERVLGREDLVRGRGTGRSGRLRLALRPSRGGIGRWPR